MCGFTTHLVLLAITLARLRTHLASKQETDLLHSLRHLPAALTNVLQVEPRLTVWAEKFWVAPARFVPGAWHPLPDRHGKRPQTAELQLLAYYTALNKRTDIDNPRNLAKSVIVE